MSETRRVIYVEDNAANFALVQRVLESTGRYSVERAETGELGLEMIRANTPDVILLDLDLPGISGIDVARELRKDPRFGAVPIVVVTASVMKRERTMALDAGAEDFIEKPFDIADLRRRIDAVLEGA